MSDTPIPLLTRIRFVAMGLVGGLLLGGAGAAKVWWDGSVAAGDLSTQLSNVETDLGVAVEESRVQSEAHTQQIKLLETRLAVAEALDAVQNENFGVARDRLKDARQLFTESGVDNAAIRKQLDAAKLDPMEGDSNAELLRGLLRSFEG